MGICNMQSLLLIDATNFSRLALGLSHVKLIIFNMDTDETKYSKIRDNRE